MSDSDSARLSATVLLGRGLTPGKLRGLQRISHPGGTLTMVALDQNSSMIDLARRALAKKGEDRAPTYDEIVEAKLDLARHLAPAASGVLIDAYYGAFSAVASGAVPGGTGLLVRVEQSGGPRNAAGAPLVAIEPGWSVEKVKRMGADALKLLAPFEPGEPDSAEHNLAAVEAVAAECRRHDLLFLLEPVSFPYGGESKADASYLARKPATVIESARILSRYCDVYKAEFPGTFDVDDVDQLHDNLLALSEASERPWVLLSAGVDYPDYLEQVTMAVECGCSGVLGGRAFWKEYFRHDGPAARSEFAATEARRRVAQVDAVVRERATPWFARYGFSAEELTGVRAAEGWHARYAPDARAAAAEAGRREVRPGDVY